MSPTFWGQFKRGGHYRGQRTCSICIRRPLTGLRQESQHRYIYTLRPFETYLNRGGIALSALEPAHISGFLEERAKTLHKAGMRDNAGALRVFLRYLHREGIVATDLVRSVPRGRIYRQASIPRAIGWQDVERLLASIDRRSILGKRDYAILTLLASYGLRAREIAALCLDDFDWTHAQISIPMRKGGHSTRYPLSATVGDVVMWSPVRAVALLVKLTLPLRTYQVRMLDSGEADTWRYAQSEWAPNTGRLASGDVRRPIRRGVFRRIEDHETQAVHTAFYINTNKTADIGKDGSDLGYVTPWQHDELLYWLEKLRNWQQKYNPIDSPTAWDELEVKHLRHARSEIRLLRLPVACFLFRNPVLKGAERAKPFAAQGLSRHWYDLLLELQNRCKARGEELPTGQHLKFVEPWEHSNSGYKTLFPLHTLRVSLLTSLALDAEVPLVVLSKLVAGHSRIFMTLYYTKVSVVRMTDVLNDASVHLAASAGLELQRFLAEASYEHLASKIVANDDAGMQAALAPNPGERNPAGWMARHHGICLVGGNSSPLVLNSRIGGCFNGGGLFRANHGGESVEHLPVPGGPGNCVRCRWFVTEPHYLDALRAHFNNLSYRLGAQAQQAQEYEQRLNTLGTQRLEAEQQCVVFTKQNEYLSLERLWESSLTKVDLVSDNYLGRSLTFVLAGGEESKAA